MNIYLLEVLKILIAEHGKTFVAARMGYESNTQLNKILNGGSIITTRKLQNLITQFNINPNYIFHGDGNLYYNKNFKPIKLPIIWEGVNYDEIIFFDCVEVKLKMSSESSCTYNTKIPISSKEYRERHKSINFSRVKYRRDKKYTVFTIYDDYNVVYTMAIPNYNEGVIEGAIEGAIKHGLL